MATSSFDPPPGQPSAHGMPLFYWEFDEPERSHLQERALLDEGHLATQLNHGVRMLALQVSPKEVPDLDVLPPADGNYERYSDAVADILQVAAWHGFDLNQIIDAALEHAEGMLVYSGGAAVSRTPE